MGDAPRLHYLHETVRLARNAASLDYMAAVAEFGNPPRAGDTNPQRPTMPGGVRLFGTHYTAAATGPWPEVVNIWECPGGLLGAWRSMLGIYHGLRPEIFWSSMEDVRLGGDGIALGAEEPTPGLDALHAEGYTCRLVVQHLTTVKPGHARAYADLLREQWLPIAADHGHRCLLLATGTYRHDQVLLLLGTDEDHRVAMQAAADSARGYHEAAEPDPRIPAFWDRARHHLATDWHEELLIPYPANTLAAP